MYKEAALREWNLNQPPWKPLLRYEQLTPAQQTMVDDRAEELELDMKKESYFGWQLLMAMVVSACREGC